MKRILSILIGCALVWGCVGQKDDPEPVDPTEQEKTEPELPPENPENPEEPEEPETPENPDPPEPTPPAPFFHRVLALEFTATWCQYCPDMAKAIEEAEPNRLVTLAVHYADELTAPETAALVSKFKITSYPTLVLDWGGAQFAETSTQRIQTYLGKKMEGEVCGIAAESAVADGTLTVNVHVKSVAEAEYSVFLALVEDGITVKNQAGYGSNYVCNDVLRGYLDAGLDGKALGTLAAEEEGSASFTAPAPENGRLVVYVLSGGRAANALSLGLNENKDYEYEEVTD